MAINGMRIAMAAPVPLREDYDAAELRRLARSSSDPGQVRRLLAVAAIYAGEARTSAAAVGGVGLQTVRDWVLRFNAKGPAGLATGKAPGQQPRLDTAQRAALRPIGGAGRVARGCRRPDRGGGGGVPPFDLKADEGPRAARRGLPQALRAPAPSR